MGQLQLSEYRTEVQSALGDRGVTDNRLDRWINFAYMELAGALDFETFDGESSATSSSGTNSLSVPTDSMTVKAVVDDDNDTLLQWVPKHEFFRLPRSQQGTPEKWTQHIDQVLLQPTPDSTVNYLVLYKDVPTRLSADTDTTAIPQVWDQAVYMLAVHYALMSLAEEQRASLWLQRAVQFIRTRVTEEDLEMSTPGVRPSWGSTGLDMTQAFGMSQVQQEGE